MYRSWVQVSRHHIAANFRAVKELVGAGVEVMPVVKADAYRHGAAEVSRILVEQGARWLAVSNAEEGVALREAGVGARILVMADYVSAERQALLEYNLTPVVHSLDEVHELERLAAQFSTRFRYHLKIDSGMGRLGTRAAAGEILDALNSARRTELEGLMTHFASAANYENPQTGEQTASFLALAGELRAAGVRPPYVHMASTTPIAYGRRETWGTMVRPGHAIYGYVSAARGEAPKQLLKVKPALSWKAAIIAVKDLPAGAHVGYGGMYKTARPARIAVLGVGYADGYPHRLSNKGKVIAAGRLAPVAGAVSMDVTTIDITDLPPLQPGDAVTLLGSDGDETLDAQQIARAAGTISYSILCGIHARVKRIYV